MLGHVAFKNVGKLPATEFISVVMEIVVHHGNWATPTLTDSVFRDHIEPGLVPIGANVKVEEINTAKKELYDAARMLGFRR